MTLGSATLDVDALMIKSDASLTASTAVRYCTMLRMVHRGTRWNAPEHASHGDFHPPLRTWRHRGAPPAQVFWLPFVLATLFIVSRARFECA